MKNIKIFTALAALTLAICSCEGYLDPKLYSQRDPEIVYTITTYVNSIPFGIYSCIPQQSGSAYMTAATDEAEDVDNTKSIHYFNTGGWNKYSNPDNVWATCYKGIRIAADYLTRTDTLTWASWRYSNPAKYAELIRNLCIGRAEARFLSAYLHFELMSRYGEVPLISEWIEVSPGMDFSQFPRTSIDRIVEYICDQCDMVCREGDYFLSDTEVAQMTNNGRNLLPVPYRDTLAMGYPTSGDLSEFLGRATRASAYALKAKTLVFYASKLFNPGGEMQRWERAAEACKKVLDLPPMYYGLEDNYSDIFNRKNNWSKEFLFAKKDAVSNAFEKANYPVSIEGGSTGLCPSQNLVDAYEVLDNGQAVAFDWNNPAHSADPYANRDPRFYATIYKHGDKYNESTVNTLVLDISEGGNSAPPIYLATKTGYYLKKYVNPALDLRNNRTDYRTWSIMRMGDFYLYYAEAANEAYGPSDAGGLGMTALQAINKIRERAGMPDVTASDQNELRKKIYNERKVELAFENIRWNDVRRWLYGQEFNKPLRGVKIEKQGLSYSYAPKVVENRVFDESKMYLYPIPQVEIDKSGGILKQNPNW